MPPRRLRKAQALARYGKNSEHCAPRSAILPASSSSVPYSMELERQWSTHDGTPP